VKPCFSAGSLVAHAATEKGGLFLFFEKLKIFQKIKTNFSRGFIAFRIYKFLKN
jgi:hypothetical protein